MARLPTNTTNAAAPTSTPAASLSRAEIEKKIAEVRKRIAANVSTTDPHNLSVTPQMRYTVFFYF